MNVAIIGSKGLAKDLAKKNTVSDIALYSTTFQGKSYTFVESEKYPEKIQTLFQVINMSNFLILYITPDLEKKYLGECILAASMSGKNGFIVSQKSDFEIKNIISGTSIENFRIIENSHNEIMEVLKSFEEEIKNDQPKILIDHAFQVKSVGTVVLGTVLSGEVKKYENMKIFPKNKDVMIKSIQINDKDVDIAKCNDRVGLALKGVDADEIQRGDIIAKNLECINEISVKIEKNRFFKDETPTNLMSIVGLQYVNSKILENKIIFDRKIVYNNERIFLISPDRPMRIFGVAFSC
ncbi:MAG: EF-Tu/IF-2/RF-3 family GTPase [Candidatus Aenigmatarchaeota archaeon]